MLWMIATLVWVLSVSPDPDQYFSTETWATEQACIEAVPQHMLDLADQLGQEGIEGPITVQPACVPFEGGDPA